ncbi:recombinase family protein [Aureimonas pseudogalii]|uniref:recombinase family protein n=1 Tax=Aureimonas pseudogalii TaxID=1744844 RepID=UPI001605BF37|nr:recombinase family protein [Aureimonas pseudogalii]
MTDQKLVPAVAYYRVSTKRQEREGISLADQKVAVEAYATQHGFTLVEAYVDGKSALTQNRPALQRLLRDAAINPPPFRAIIVYAQSRFGRNAPETELTLRDLRRRGVELYSVTQQIARDEGGDLMRQLLAVVDEHSSRETAKHVRSTMRANASAGYWNGSAPPFGYRTYVCEVVGKKQKKKLAVDEVEAPVVRMIYRLAQIGDNRSGPMGVKNIASHLNAAGYRTRSGKMWHTGPLHALMTNSVYKGVYVYNQTDSRTREARDDSQHVQVSCPAIVDASTWDAVRQLLRSRNPKVALPKTVLGPILLTGLVRCADCGGAMTIRTGKSGRYRYYTCATQQARGKSACAGRSVPMDKLDHAVTTTLVRHLFEPSRLARMLQMIDERRASSSASENRELIRIEEELARANARLAVLYDGVELGALSLRDPDIAGRIERAKTERAIAQAGKERVLARIGPSLDLTPEKVVALSQVMSDRIANGAVAFRKSYIRATVDSIVVGDHVATVRGRNDVLRQQIGKVDQLAELVPSSVQEWRTRQDSNL